MTTTTVKTHSNSNVPITKHLYEIEPRRGDKRHLMIEASSGRNVVATEEEAMGLARTFLAENPEFTSVGLYHTYPNNGPVRRYVREVKPTII